ncbi:large ribosomal subunit protein mL37-like [Sycon ciliatum]|uniref:large ribosomal subunit protein mL37-like n=1 Tax=Sycon ciliatum TaxID=27933 RepID=UPI0020A86A54|eukprot:scpid33215/ scgid14545/ 39S ribosomal protein L37, mitochondrial
MSARAVLRPAACLSRIAACPVGAVRFKRPPLAPKIPLSKEHLKPFYDIVPPGLTEDCPLTMEMNKPGRHYALWKREFMPKAIHIEGLPEDYYAPARGLAKKLITNHDLLENAANETLLYDPPDYDEYLHPTHRGWQMFYLFHRILMQAEGLPRYAVKDMMLTADVAFRFLWTRIGRNVQALGRAPFLITSRHPLPPPIAQQSELDRMSEEHQFHDGTPISPFYGMLRRDYGEPRINYPLNPRSLLQYPHTLVMIQRRRNVQNEITHMELSVFQFAILAAFAVTRLGYKLGQPCPMPLTMQAIYTNGREVQLSCFQLNTLEMDSSYGLKNVTWSERKAVLYDVPEQDDERRYLINGVKEDVFNKYYSFFLNYDFDRLDKDTDMSAAQLF